MLIKGKPYIEKLENRISLFNEIMVSLYLYQLLALTDYSQQALPSSDAAGWGLVATVLTSVGVNFLKFF